MRAEDGGDWRYYGNDTGGTSVVDRDVSLATAKRPSYALLTSTGKIDQVRLKYDEKRILSVGLSGRLKGGEYFPDGNIYSLEVRDLSGCIYVNDGLKMQGGNRSSVSENLRRILNVLGRQEAVGVSTLGDMVLDSRPAVGGYATAAPGRAYRRPGRTSRQIGELEPQRCACRAVSRACARPPPRSRRCNAAS